MSFKKLHKLINNPNQFFFDYFRKKLGLTSSEINNKGKKNITSITSNCCHDLKCISAIEFEDNIKKISMYKYKDTYYINNTYGLLAFIESLYSCLCSGFDVSIICDNIDVINFRKKVLKFKDIYKKLSAVNHCYVEVSTGTSIKAIDINIIEEKDGFWQSKNGVRRILPSDIKNIKSPSYDFEVDIVYTYVDSNDLDWQKKFIDTFGSEKEIDFERYAPHDELKYSLRSVNQFAPWVRKIFIVSNCAKPAWLDTNNDKIAWVSHEEIFPDNSVLPNFNSHAIESCLHKIKGLSDHFIYFNDDFIINRMTYKHDFFTETGKSISFSENYDVAFWDKDHLDEPGYRAAAINGQNLLMKSFSYCPRYMMQHAPYAINKMVLEEMEDAFYSSFESTRKHKTRDYEDISVLSFLYHHYAYCVGKAIHKNQKAFIVREVNYKKMIKNSHAYKFLCFNDLGIGASNYISDMQKFIESKFFIKPDWELF